jgi:hypothetical protein
MKVLVACEESQAVTIELRKLGHEAYSCDIEPCSGGHPEWHIQHSAIPLINPKNYMFYYVEAQSGKEIELPNKWDMIIAFPPCTHLCSSGARWFAEGAKPIELQYQARDFFMMFANADCKKIAIENPVGKMSTYYRKPDQIINPYEYGHPEQKKTCLWLKGLPKLKATNNVHDYMMTLPIKERTRIHWLGSNHSRERSKTYTGIAQAMAEQWGNCHE